MTFPQQLAPGQANAEVPANENWSVLASSATYGKKASTTAGLVWGYYGGRWGGFLIADSTLALTGSATNYVVVSRTTGLITVSTSATNWNDDVGYSRVYKIATNATAVTSVEDHRVGPRGVLWGDSGDVLPVLAASNGAELIGYGDDTVAGALNALRPGIRSLSEIGVQASNAIYTDLVEMLLQEAADDGDAVYVPPEPANGLIDRPMDVYGMLSVFGISGLSQIRTVVGGLDAPIITIHVTSDIESPLYRVGGFLVYNDRVSTDNQLSAGIAFSGSKYLTYVDFSNLYSIGCYCTVKNLMDTFPSPFGEESYLNNCKFDNIWTFYRPGSVNAKYGVWHTNGSGTGNDYRNMKGNIARRGFPVTSVTVTNQGSGYSTPPVVTVSDPTSGLALTAVLGSGGTAGKVVSLTITSPGFLRPTDTIIFTGGGGTGAAASFTTSTANDIASLPSHVRVDGGPGVVCGDILVDGTITALDSALLSADGTMAYLNAMRIGPMAQVDAQARAAIRFEPANTASYGLTMEQVVGGETDIASQYGRMQGSIVRHQGVGKQEAGVARAGIAAGGVSKVIGTVELRNYSGGTVIVSADGLVQGVGGGTAMAMYVLSYGDTGNAIATVALTDVSPGGFTGLAITASAVGRVITFSVLVTGSADGSDIDGQISVMGGHLKLTRGTA